MVAHPTTSVTDVRRLVCSHPSFRVAVRDGLDPDDLLQDVCVAVYTRTWHPERGSWSKFVWLVTRSVVANQRRRARLRQVEALHDADLGSSREGDHLDGEAQLVRACAELGLGGALEVNGRSVDVLEVVRLVATGQLRRDDKRVVAIAERVRALLAAADR